MGEPRLLGPTDMRVDNLAIIGAERPDWSIEHVTVLPIDRHGIPGDGHYGRFRTMREYQSVELAGFKVPNDRQVSIVDASDMEAIAHDIGLPTDAIEERAGLTVAEFMAGQFGANIALRSSNEGGLRAIARPGVQLVFSNPAQPLGQPLTQPTVVRLTEYARPCPKPANRLLHSLAQLGLQAPQPPREFWPVVKEAANARRGWVGSVVIPGTIIVGESVAVYNPLGTPEAA